MQSHRFLGHQFGLDDLVVRRLGGPADDFCC